MLVRELEERAFAKTFEVGNNEELCNSTGIEVCFDGDDPTDPGNWWNEYIDSKGSLHYGR